MNNSDEELFFLHQKDIVNQDLQHQVKLNNFVAIDFTKGESVEDFYNQATVYEKAFINDDVIYIHYEKEQDKKLGRTLIVTNKGQLLRTKILPEQLIKQYYDWKMERHTALQLFEFPLISKYTPLVCGGAIFIPVKNGKKAYRSWLGIHHVDNFIQSKGNKTKVQILGLHPIQLRLDVYYETLLSPINMAYTIWKLQYNFFKSLYELHLGMESPISMKQPHFFNQKLAANVQRFKISEAEMTQIEETVQNRLEANSRSVNFEQYF